METSSFRSLALLSLLMMLLIGCGITITKNCYYNSKDANDKNKETSTTASKPVIIRSFYYHK